MDTNTVTVITAVCGAIVAIFTAFNNLMLYRLKTLTQASLAQSVTNGAALQHVHQCMENRIEEVKTVVAAVPDQVADKAAEVAVSLATEAKTA